MRQSYSVEARRASWTMSMVPMAYTCFLVSGPFYIPEVVLTLPSKGLKMRWPLSKRAIQLSLSMSALRIDWTLSGVRHSSYSPSKNTWASMRKRSWVQLDQRSSRRPRPGLLTKRPLSWDVGRISVQTMFSAAPDKAQKGPSRSRTWDNRTTQQRHHYKGERGRTRHCKSSYACHSEASPARISSSKWAVPL